MIATRHGRADPVQPHQCAGGAESHLAPRREEPCGPGAAGKRMEAAVSAAMASMGLISPLLFTARAKSAGPTT